MISLLRPWSYLLIRPQTSDLKMVNYYLPLGLALVTIFSSYLINSDGATIFLDDSALIKIGSFIQTLPGFYLAALAAIATFSKPDLDAFLLGKELYISNEDGNEIRLTRRRFLTIMFAYLTVQSFVFSLLCVMINNINFSIFDYATNNYLAFIVGGFLFFIFWQLITITLWGIFYLAEKIHTPNP